MEQAKKDTSMQEIGPEKRDDAEESTAKDADVENDKGEKKGDKKRAELKLTKKQRKQMA